MEPHLKNFGFSIADFGFVEPEIRHQTSEISNLAWGEELTANLKDFVPDESVPNSTVNAPGLLPQNLLAQLLIRTRGRRIEFA